eukprot:TRINITY_DN3360_c0_g1_i1.p1 TRINITY_DN3360_c0_g1~~TRINITY_DN3360_c0_g1_i1.p1  ORF type:complete len:320 (-),score=55.04 TRINITY_DN3360_c0_g1_i1:199-1158(-)
MESRSNRICSSIVASGIVSVFVNPFDVLRVRMQNTMSKSTLSVIKKKCACGRMFYVPIQCCKKSTGQNSGAKLVSTILKAEGLGGLWSGTLATMFTMIPQSMIYYSLYDELKPAMESTILPGFLVPAVAGGFSRSIAATVVSPFELIRTNLQANGSELGIWGTAKREMKTSGVKALWRGLIPTLGRDIPFSVIYWSAFEMIRPHLQKNRKPNNQRSSVSSFFTGVLAGSIATVSTHPFDIIKTRRQLGLYGLESTLPKTCSLPALVKQLFLDEGIAGLTVGLGPRLLRVSIACGIMISSYDLIKSMIQKSTGAEENQKM